MLLTAFAAVSICGTTLNVKQSPSLGRDFVLMILYFSPTWVPLVFGAFALGRQSLSAKFIIVFAIVEGIALYAMSWAVLV
jgi:hypothetical protein